MWSTGYSVQVVAWPLLVLFPGLCGVGWRGTRWWGLVGSGTLLGPEGTGLAAPERVAFGSGVMGLGCFFWCAGPGAVRCCGVAGLVVPVVF
jgi:hypothetical protein